MQKGSEEPVWESGEKVVGGKLAEVAKALTSGVNGFTSHDLMCADSKYPRPRQVEEVGGVREESPSLVLTREERTLYDVY